MSRAEDHDVRFTEASCERLSGAYQPSQDKQRSKAEKVFTSAGFICI